MTQTVPDISPLMPMHQDPLLVYYMKQSLEHGRRIWYGTSVYKRQNQDQISFSFDDIIMEKIIAVSNLYQHQTSLAGTIKST